MASRAPNPFRIGHHWIEIALGAATAALLVAGLSPQAADAGLLGKKKTPEDFTAIRAAPVAVPPAAANGSIFQAEGGYAALYEGSRARRVGDPLTIVLVEKTAATKSAGSKLDSKGDLSITAPTTGVLSFLKNQSTSAGTGRTFNGTGAADQSNSLSGEVSVTVAQVLPNGTMLVQGQKRVTLNRGDEFVQIKGLVRTADIDADNRILSTRVADAQIAYTGKGDVARASRQGWLGRFFSVVSPF
ncbi:MULTISPECIES: flagellar basal body L-ring protein FlgH [unclassified Sphingomonas]|uniref:flagellar basal body L-ring protein FlgH n=1 Tax=unclassified Sphingomonas TaxID=196159 RepID=UPI001F592E2D|nr:MULTISPECIES: flagellar basal body L-ring protein FlgH [unclassified Sphingomonas]